MKKTTTKALFVSAILKLLLLSNTCLAGQTVIVEWQPPTEREDGTSITVNELAKYTIRYQCNTQPEQLIVVQGGNVTSYEITSIHGKCTFDINSTDTAGLTSDWSNAVTTIIKLDKPKIGGFR